MISVALAWLGALAFVAHLVAYQGLRSRHGYDRQKKKRNILTLPLHTKGAEEPGLWECWRDGGAATVSAFTVSWLTMWLCSGTVIASMLWWVGLYVAHCL